MKWFWQWQKETIELPTSGTVVVKGTIEIPVEEEKWYPAKTLYGMVVECQCGHIQEETRFENSPEVAFTRVCPKCGRDAGEMTLRSVRATYEWRLGKLVKGEYEREVRNLKYIDSEHFTPIKVKDRGKPRPEVAANAPFEPPQEKNNG